MISVASEANDHTEYEQLMYGHVGEKLAVTPIGRAVVTLRSTSRLPLPLRVTVTV